METIFGYEGRLLWLTVGLLTLAVALAGALLAATRSAPATDEG
jgi:high-affinity Fe2+/Pb2+ permease